MCLTLDISEKVTDHSKSKDSKGDTERGREKISSFLMGIKMKVIWEGMPTEICPTDLKTCIRTKTSLKNRQWFY